MDRTDGLIGGCEGQFEMFVGQAPYATRGPKSENEKRTILSGTGPVYGRLATIQVCCEYVLSVESEGGCAKVGKPCVRCRTCRNA